MISEIIQGKTISYEKTLELPLKQQEIDTSCGVRAEINMVTIRLGYRKAGTSYFSSQDYEGGYYVSVTGESATPDGWRKFTAGAGFNAPVLTGVTRNTAKQRAIAEAKATAQLPAILEYFAREFKAEL